MSAVQRLTVQLLGPVTLLNASVPILVQGQRQLRFLTSLALRPGQFVTKEAIIQDSWDSEPPRTVSGQLQTSAWKIRAALREAGLPKDVLTSNNLGYQLHVPVERIDLFVFRDVLRDVRALCARGEYDAAVLKLDAGLSMWKGTALADVASGRLRLQAEGLDRERAAAIELRTQIDIEMQRYEEAIGRLTELLDQDPLREDLYVWLMKAYYGAGRPADAIQVFHRAKEMLREQIGISPGVRLKEALQSVLHQDELFPTSSPAFSRTPKVPALPLRPALSA